MDLSHGVLCAFWILGIVSCCLGQTLKCGDISTSQAGTIMSPNFPSNYPDTVTCNWTITVASNQVITLRFHRFGVDPSDRVTFYDGNSTSGPVLKGNLSGYWEDARVSNVRIRTTGPSLHIVFRAWGAPSGIGFSASYWAHECQPFTFGMDYCVNTCSCNQNNTLFCNNTSGECTCKSGWETTTCDTCTFGYQCKDPFSDCFKKVGSNACECRQGLEINQRTGQCDSTCTTQQNQCSHACGVISKNPYIQQCYCPHGMKLDPANNRTCVECTGWSFGEDCKHQATCVRERTQMVNKINGSCTCYTNWTSVDCSQDVDECSLDVCNRSISRCMNFYGNYACDCKGGYEKADEPTCRECGRTLTNSTGTITVSDYYYNEKPEVCWWTIIVDADNVIDLNFTGLYIYQDGQINYMNIYDGPNISAPLLRHIDGLTYHRGRLPGLIRSSGNTIHMIQYSNHHYVYGFQVSYRTQKCKIDFYGVNCSTPCNCFKNNTEYCDSITGECMCKKQWTSSDCTVDKNECLVDPLACPNNSECRNLQPGYECDCYLGLLKNTQGECVFANGTVSNGTSSSCSRRCSGLCVHIKASGQEQCYCPIGTELVGDTCTNCHAGTFGPNCSFQCSCSKNNTVSCNPVTGRCECKPGWTSATCTQDFDECYFDSYKCPQKSTCRNTPGDYECSCDSIYSLENVDARTCRKIDCHHTLTAPSGNLSSPNYPSNYFYDTNCTWIITAEPGNVISVRFEAFTTYPLTDYLTFYNGDNVNGQIIGRYTGELNRTVPRLVRSVGNSMFISFTTLNMDRGFSAKYYTHPCPDFMFGDTCYEPCRCNITNTDYCDNIKGDCLCKLGWKGYTCIDDVSECLGINNFLCPPDSDCRNTDGNYTCICHQGFLKNTSTNLCDPVNSATTTRQPGITQPTIGQPTVDGNIHQDYICHFGYIDVHIPVSLVPDSKLWLQDDSCKLVNNGTHHVINVPYDECGTDVHNYRNYTLMTNKITVHTDLDVGGGVVFGEDYTIDLSCTIPKHQSVDGSFQGVTAEPVLETSENKTMGYILKEYETADYTKEITSFPVLIPSNRNIFFEVSLKAEDRINSSYGIKVDECKATPSLDPNNPTHFTMISNNCPAVSAVHILTNPSLDVFRFYIHSFHFSGADNKDNYVYVHCDVTICPKTSCPNGCSVPGRRRRRSNASPLVTLTIGPYIFVDDKLH